VGYIENDTTSLDPGLRAQINRFEPINNIRQNRIFMQFQKTKSSYEGRKIKPLNQKTKDRLAVLGILALESLFVYGSISNFYRYILLKIALDLFLAVFSTIGTAILFVFILVILANYLDKRKFLKSFQK
jgi:hypothetical protein